MIAVEVVTPEKTLYNKDSIIRVILPLSSGEYEVLPKHSPYIAKLESDTIEIEFDDGTKDYLAVHGGFVEILEDKIKIIAFIAEKKDEIDKMRAIDSLNRAKERIDNNKFDNARVLKSMKRAETRLKLVNL